MKARPILFSGAMVRAIIDGRKTETRRAVKPQPPVGHQFAGWTVSSTHTSDEGKAVWGHGDTSALLRDAHRVRCPYGLPGDLLWVRETWRVNPVSDFFSAAQISNTASVFYEVDNHDCWGKKRPSIFMPRWASRITLEITGVRVERLQDISESDAEAEGCRNSLHLQGGRFAKENFAHLWWTIHGDDSWEANPLVWVIEFKPIMANVDAVLRERNAA